MIELSERFPRVPAQELLAEFVPGPRFARTSFATYLPSDDEPSQADALAAVQAFGASLGSAPTTAAPSGRWFRSGRRARAAGAEAQKQGVYLDGGYGVGKTHLLASLWQVAPGPKAYGTFVEYTNLVGALGFADAVRALSGYALVCIDEFELDDPGDTVLISTLLARLSDAGVRLAATSNTLPDKLGEGRFAAEDFLREIQGLAARFEVIRIDGPDYRHRGLPEALEPASDAAVIAHAEATPGASLDDFRSLIRHLEAVHPSRYGHLLDGVAAVHLTQVATLANQADALRLVVLADRMYEQQIPLVASGVPVDQVFAEDMLHGGYRKKYFRAISRLVALQREAGE